MKLVNLLFVIALCLLGIVFAVANRQWVYLSMDPFSQTNPAVAIQSPLYGIVFGSFLLGIAVGGMVMWTGQGNLRRNLRDTKKQEKELRKKVEQSAPAAENSGLPAVASQTGTTVVPTSLPQK